MEMETTDSRGKEDVYHRVAMDDEVFKEYVKMLDQMCVKTFHDIELYIALRISGSYNEMVKAGEKLLVINKSLFEILRKVDEVCYCLDENVQQEKYDLVKKFEYDIMDARYNIEEEIERRVKERDASRLYAKKVVEVNDHKVEVWL